ncbi:hypothetical protein RHDC4_00610 [Rhodocyclaceae bacterium]|nr:hypothetical protein RHDC4_00610 [Rhodocyclaceae bacterium]
MKNALMTIFLAIFVVLMAAVFLWQPLTIPFSKASITNDFVLQTTEGALDSKLLRGKVLALFFGYAGCGDECGTRLEKLKKSYEMLHPGDRAQVRIIIVTVDPERDTPARIGEYAHGIHRDFIGATGKPEDIKAMAEAFAVNYAKHTLADGSYIVQTSPMIYVVDAEGKFASVLNDNLPVDKTADALRSRVPTPQLPGK